MLRRHIENVWCTNPQRRLKDYVCIPWKTFNYAKCGSLSNVLRKLGIFIILMSELPSDSTYSRLHLDIIQI